MRAGPGKSGAFYLLATPAKIGAKNGDGEQYQEKRVKTEKEKTAEQLAREEENIEFELASELCPASQPCYTQWGGYPCARTGWNA